MDDVRISDGPVHIRIPCKTFRCRSRVKSAQFYLIYQIDLKSVDIHFDTKRSPYILPTKVSWVSVLRIFCSTLNCMHIL